MDRASRRKAFEAKRAARKAPWPNAKHYELGQESKGMDGDVWIVKPAGSAQRWYPYRGIRERAKVYRTSSKDGQPYEVRVTDLMTNIFKLSRTELVGGKRAPIYEYLMSFPLPKQVFVGDAVGGPKANSVLIQVDARKCVYVGHQVHEFELKPGDRVKGYTSPMKTDEDPQGIARGEGRQYLMATGQESVPGKDVPLREFKVLDAPKPKAGSKAAPAKSRKASASRESEAATAEAAPQAATSRKASARVTSSPAPSSGRSPAESADDVTVGTEAKGIDGNFWVALPSGKGQAWFPYRGPREKEQVWFTNWNGGTPFRVHVTKQMVNVFKFSKIVGKGRSGVVIFDFSATFPSPMKVFIGEDPDYPKLKGNSVLLRMAPRKYVYIGHMMYEFEPREGDDIVSYLSRVGNSNVPFPHANGIDYRYHLAYGTYGYQSHTGESDRETDAEIDYLAMHGDGLPGMTVLEEPMN